MWRKRLFGGLAIALLALTALGAGSAHGATIGMPGYLTDESGRPNTTFELAEVQPSISIAYVHDTHDNVVARLIRFLS